VDENGISRFQLLQRLQKQPTVCFVFDVLWTDGTDITRKTVLERRAVLESIIKQEPGIQLGSL
jgi:ATP-dependent DNA ligase